MRLAVILPVFNAQNYLEESLNSLLNQTFKDFCIIAVNDCSTDNSGQILEQYAKNDSRLRVYHFDKNQGEPIAVKFAMDMTKSMQIEYVARMDSDDIALPERFQKQIDYLDSYADVIVLGTDMQLINVNNDLAGQANMPTEDLHIKANLILARGNIANPTAMWRLDWFKKFNIHYGATKTACDFAMWVDCAIHQAKFANLAEPLVKYRLHQNQLSHKHNDVNQSVQITLEKYVYTLFPQLTANEVKNLVSLCHGAGTISLNRPEINQGFQVFDKIKSSVSPSDTAKLLILDKLQSRINFWQNLINQ